MRKRLSEQQIAEAVGLYDGGVWNSVSLSEKYGCSTQYVANILKANGVQMRRAAYKKVATKDGYLLVKPNRGDEIGQKMASSNGYVLEHRLNMAHNLGRPLRTDETVHHIDGNKANNDISNLQLRQGNHGKGVYYECSDCGSHNIEARKLAETMV